MKYNELDNSFIIVNAGDKNRFLYLKNEYPYLDFKLLDMSFIKKKLTYDYDDRSLIFLHRKGYSYANAKDILDNLLFLKEGVSDKVDNLIAIKQQLDDENLLIYDNSYDKFLSKRKVLIYLAEEDEMLNRLLDMHKIKYQYIKEKKQNHLQCFVFEQFEDEIRYLFEKIFHLMKKGIPANKIKIVVEDQDYIKAIRKYQKMFNLKFAGLEEEKYISTPDYLNLIRIMKTTIFEQAYDFIVNKVEDYIPLEKLLQKYLMVKDYILDVELEDYFNYLAKNISLTQEHYDNEIKICSLQEVNDEDYVFVLGFNLKSYPHIFNDDDYLNDEEKQKLGLMVSFDRQIKEEEKLINKLSSIDNLFISYAANKDKLVYYQSLLIKKYNIELLNYQFEDKVYSKTYFKMMMGKIFDDERNFSYRHSYYDSASKNEIDYLSYNHKFNGLSSFTMDKLSLSYTEIQAFYECQFKYYIRYIIKADEFEESVQTTIGNFVHKLLELTIKGQAVDFDKALDEFDNHKDFRILTRALKPMILKAVDNLKSLKEKTFLNNYLAEDDSYTYKIDERTILNGKFDLILYDNKYYVIIDYKTNNTEFETSLVKYGLSMQLPIYALLSGGENSSLKSLSLGGLYINNVLDKNFYDGDYDYLLLKGLSFDEKAISCLGRDFIKKSRNKYVIYDKETFDNLIEICKEKLSEASVNIIKGNFIINPKMKKNKNMSCTYCPFNDICYHDFYDFVYLKEEGDDK